MRARLSLVVLAVGLSSAAAWGQTRGDVWVARTGKNSLTIYHDRSRVDINTTGDSRLSQRLYTKDRGIVLRDIRSKDLNPHFTSLRSVGIDRHRVSFFRRASGFWYARSTCPLDPDYGKFIRVGKAARTAQVVNRLLGMEPHDTRDFKQLMEQVRVSGLTFNWKR